MSSEVQGGRERAGVGRWAAVLPLLAVFLVAAGLRLYHLGSAPVALNQDEAVNGYDAYSLAYTLRDHHGHFLPPMLQAFNDWTSPALTFLTAPVVRALGLSETTVRLPGAIAGLLAVLLVYVLLRRLGTTRQGALFGALILAVSSWNISLSRWAIPPNVTPLFSFIFLWAVVRMFGEPARERWWAAAAGAIAGVIAYTYAAEKLAAPLMVGCSALAFLAERWRCGASRLRSLVTATLMSVVFLAVVLPLAIAQVQGGESRNWHFQRMSLLRWSVPAAGEALGRYAEYFSPSFAFGAGDPDPLQHVPGHPAVPLVGAPFLLLGLVSCIRRRPARGEDDRPQPAPTVGFWLVALTLVAPIPGSLTVEHMHTNRALHLLILTPVLAGLGFDMAARLAFRRWRTLVLACVAAVALLEAASFARFYFGDYREQTKAEWQYGVKQALRLAREHSPACGRVIVDLRINQPYIYYLFFSAYPPRQLDYAAINRHGEDQNWLRVPEVGSYSFAELSQEVFATATVVGTVRDSRRVWFRLWQDRNHGRCIVERTY